MGSKCIIFPSIDSPLILYLHACAIFNQKIVVIMQVVQKNYGLLLGTL